MKHLACVSSIVDNINHNQSNRYGQSNSNYFAIPYAKVSPGNSISFNVEFIILYKRDFTYADYWSTSSVRTITAGNTSYLIRASIPKSKSRTAYIKNNTTGEYYYKGEDV